MNATETQLEGASSSCERWEWGFAGLVVVAVIVEFIIASIHPSYDSFLEQWGTATADAAIALGIVGEVLFGRRDAAIQNELRRRSIDRASKLEKEAAEARERTAQIERITAWRHIPSAKIDWIAQSLRNAMPLNAEQLRYGKIRRNDDENILIDAIIDCPDSAEVITFKNEIAFIFEHAQFDNVVHRLNPGTFKGDLLFGIYVSSRPPGLAKILKDVFAQFDITLTIDDELADRFMAGAVFGRKNLNEWLHLYVGHKPRS